jgi:hypothetical protein
MKRAFLLALALCSVGSFAADKFDAQDVRKSFVADCSIRGISRGDDPQKVTSFCACSFEVIANGMTVAEYLDMDRAVKEKRPAEQLPQLTRVRAKMEQCKSR